jgi:hypothetical protein
MPKDVFISYARRASREFADALHGELGEDLAFLDREDIPFGDAFPERLVDALLDSRVVVILAEPVYFTRWYCLLEYRLTRTPFLRLAERPGVAQRERDAALNGIVIAMPPGDADPMLERFPAFVQGRNWASVTEPASIAGLVRQRLDESLPTLRERYQALGELAAIREIVLETTMLPGPGRIGPIPLAPVTGLSPSIRDRFVGRAKDIWRLHDVLTTERGEPTAAALTGAIEAGGGFGKTRLALEYLYRFGTRHFRGGLFWINAEQDVESQHYEVVQALDPSAPPVEVLRAAQGGVGGALARIVRLRSDAAPPLFVIDNVPEPEAGKPPFPLSHWCPLIGEVAVLATSRTRVALGGAGSIVPGQIDTLEPDAAVRLLSSGTRREELSEAEWTEVAGWVGNLPLALELLNGLLASGAMSAHELLAMSREQRLTDALDTAMDVLRGTVPEGTLRGVTQAFAESYERLSEAEQYAARLIAWMAPALVPDFVLELLRGNPFSAQIRAVLRTRHFVTSLTAVGTAVSLPLYGSMHRVLADFLRLQSINPDYEIALLVNTFEQFSKAQTGDEWLRAMNLAGPPVTALLVNALESGVSVLDSDSLSGRYASLNRLATALYDAAEYGSAQKCFEELSRILARRLGGDHPHTLSAMDNLAETLAVRGDLASARSLQERVLDTRRRTLGDEHPETLTTINNLAVSLQDSGDIRAAVELLEGVHSILQRTKGEQDSSTLIVMSNLSFNLFALGHCARAQAILDRVVAIAKSELGEEDHVTLRSMNNLAHFRYQLEDYAGALPLHEHVLAVRRRVLGIEHPETSTAAWNVLTDLLGIGNDDAARRVWAENLAWLLEQKAETLGRMHRRIQSLLEGLGTNFKSR